MQQPGAVLLVSCYELGHQPVNLASPLAHLEAAGFAPVAVDTAVQTLDDSVLAQARFIAISAPMHTALRLGSQVAERVREINPAAHICFYGLYAVLNQEHLFAAKVADSAIGGEYELALVDLAGALHEGRSLTDLPGVTTPGNRSLPILAKIPFLPPNRASLPGLRDYAGLAHHGEIIRAGYVETTRGCHHTCAHCPITPIYNGRFFALPRATVVADARSQILSGARHITFGDPDFFNGPQHGLRVMRDLREEFPWLTFDATIKVEHLLEHQKLLPELGELGCVFVVSAVESIYAGALAHMKKGHTKADVATALELLDAAGIAMRPSLLPFSPWETLESYRELLAFIAEQDLIEHVDPVHLSIRLLIPPESAVLQDPGREAWLGELDAPNFSYRWRHPDERMDDLQRKISKLAERAAIREKPHKETFAEIWKLTHEALGETSPALPDARFSRPEPPRLTEHWFC
ncbi:MAG: CUAEP/CCAEP-tail radical SAM (seleno)protein [Thermomicrobiales bacterium]